MVLISPFSKRHKGKINAKEYPYWKELIALLQKDIVQIGVTGDEQFVKDFRVGLSLKTIEELVKECEYWISIDSFLPHLAHQSSSKPGVVIFGTGSPILFGYPENINIIKGMNYIRKDKFNYWWDEPHVPEVFVSPEEVYGKIREKFYR